MADGAFTVTAVGFAGGLTIRTLRSIDFLFLIRRVQGSLATATKLQAAPR